MRKRMSYQPHIFGNPMESIESMRTVIQRSSINRIKVDIRRKLNDLSDFYRDHTSKRMNKYHYFILTLFFREERLNNQIFELDNEGSIVSSNLVKPKRSRSIPGMIKSFNKFCFEYPNIIKRKI